jgi:hypothetical protein
MGALGRHTYIPKNVGTYKEIVNKYPDYKRTLENRVSGTGEIQN